jgi:N-acetylmuramoyl-L-alanine amidase
VDPSALSISKKANGYTIKIPLKTNYKITHKYLKDEDKVVIKFPTGNLNLKYIEQTDDDELIEKITFVNHPSSSELSLNLTQELEGTDVYYSEATQTLNILLFKNFNVDSLFKAERESKTSGKNDNNLDTQRKKWEINNIIIDPGHGGKDPGCIGITKKYEKDIVLKIGLKLGKLIEKKTKIKVHYTRKTDTLIHVDKRGQIANDKKGNLFISLHCNSIESRDPKASGFSAYILRPGKTDEAIAVAERENSVIKYEPGYQERYKHLSEENFILTTIAQSAFIKFSETFAEKLCLSVQKNKLPLKDNGVLQAGFYVLVGASMPSVLVECGYLTNKKDEAFLNSDSGQNKLAEAIFDAILAYQQEYEKSLNEGK